MADRVPARLTTAEGRRFGLAVGGALLAVAAVSAWRGHHNVGLAAALAGTTLLITGYAAPSRLSIVYRAWMALGVAVSRVTTPVLLGLVYYMVFTPVGLARRLVARNPSARSGERSYWIPRGEARRSDLTRQF